MPSAKRPRPGTRRGRSSLSSRRLLPPAAILLIALGVVARAPAVHHGEEAAPFSGERLRQLRRARGEDLVEGFPFEPMAGSEQRARSPVGEDDAAVVAHEHDGDRDPLEHRVEQELA